MKFWIAGLALLLGGCAEMRQAPPPEPPAELAGGIVARPLLAILDAAARDFDRAGIALDGRPRETALALARLEWMGGEARPGRSLSALPESFLFALQRAVEEGRFSIGIVPDATPEATVPALLAAARALGRNEEAAVAGMLVPPAFAVTNRSALSRLREPGPFPNAGLAVIAIRDEVARRGMETRAARSFGFQEMGAGVTTFGMGGGTDR